MTKPKKSAAKEPKDADDVVLKWLREQGAVESQTYNEETGAPERCFTIKLR